MYKIIAVDMDGTLLNSKKEVTPFAYNIINKCISDKGVKFIIATGRPLTGVASFLKTFDYDLEKTSEYVINYNGAAVYDLREPDMPIIKKVIYGNEVMPLAKIAKEHNMNCHAFSVTRSLLSPAPNPYSQLEVDLCNVKLTISDLTTVPEDEEFFKFMFLGTNEELNEFEKTPIIQELRKKYTVVRSSDVFLEILNKEVGKGDAIKSLCEKLNISLDEVVSFGDQENDLSMIEVAGRGCAMENAISIVKERANVIVETNDEDGVAKELERLLKANQI